VSVQDQLLLDVALLGYGRDPDLALSIRRLARMVLVGPSFDEIVTLLRAEVDRQCVEQDQDL